MRNEVKSSESGGFAEAEHTFTKHTQRGWVCDMCGWHCMTETSVSVHRRMRLQNGKCIDEHNKQLNTSTDKCTE